jgi:hypothetical protein
VGIDDILPKLLDSDSDEEHMMPAANEPPMLTRRSTRTDSYENIQKYIEGTAEYDQEHKTALALTVSLDAAITSAATMTPTATEPNHYKDAMKAPGSAKWKAACNIEMKKLRERNCWTVVKRADIPKGTRVKGGRWTFKYTRDETGALSKVSLPHNS